MYEINALPAQLSLGNQGEGDVTLVQIDVSAWLTEWPAGVFAVTFIPPMMTEPAPVPVAVEAGMLSFTVSKSMTARYGTGTLVIKLIEGEDLEKRSVVVQTKVLESHPPATGTMPTVVQDWVSAAQAKLGEVDHFVDDAQTATDAANAAAVRAENGENERENAEGLRVIAEQGRHDAYELAEAARDGLYYAAESDRDGLFNTSQTERTNAYNLRENQRDDAYAAAELIREGAETARETAEGLREGAETARETAEGLREEAEGLREQGETNRGNAYSQAESARDGLYATAESARDGLFEAAETTRNAQTGDAVGRANTIAETLEGIAPKWSAVDISASGLAAGAAPTASVTQDVEGTHLTVGIPKGDKGDKGDAGNVMYATFDIIDGELIVTTPDGYTGPTFSIVNNELEVSI